MVGVVPSHYATDVGEKKKSKTLPDESAQYTEGPKVPRKSRLRGHRPKGLELGVLT